MEKEATINSLFGETIYFAHINNDNKKTAKHVESFVKEKLTNEVSAEEEVTTLDACS